MAGGTSSEDIRGVQEGNPVRPAGAETGIAAFIGGAVGPISPARPLRTATLHIGAVLGEHASVAAPIIPPDPAARRDWTARYAGGDGDGEGGLGGDGRGVGRDDEDAG